MHKARLFSMSKERKKLDETIADHIRSESIMKYMIEEVEQDKKQSASDKEALQAIKLAHKALKLQRRNLEHVRDISDRMSAGTWELRENSV